MKSANKRKVFYDCDQSAQSIKQSSFVQFDLLTNSIRIFLFRRRYCGGVAVGVEGAVFRLLSGRMDKSAESKSKDKSRRGGRRQCLQMVFSP